MQIYLREEMMPGQTGSIGNLLLVPENDAERVLLARLDMQSNSVWSQSVLVSANVGGALGTAQRGVSINFNLVAEADLRQVSAETKNGFLPSQE